MENDNLISKKELLEKYGISYGALYRWKRKGLIPDDWFIKKSTVTGQETFFPRELVCERVELILNEKEEVLLDELAKKISGQQSADRVLTLMTAFGEKSFRMSDVKSIILESGKGKKTDITLIIQNLFDTEDKSL